MKQQNTLKTVTLTPVAIEFLLVGASAVRVGTASFRDPDSAARIAAGMAAWCEREGVADMRELVGALRLQDGGAPGLVA